jgi:choline kinase
MQALILAAGIGSRLGALTEHSTKCMLRVHGKRLIEHLLDGLLLVGIEHAVLVVGHGAAEVRAFLGDRYRSMRIEYIENPLYRTTNNSYSVALAAAWLCADDTVLIESDLLLDPAIVQACLSHPGPDVAALASYAPWMDGTVTLLEASGQINQFIPKQRFDPAMAEHYYKTVNLYKISRTFAETQFIPLLRHQLATRGSQMYYETIFEQIIAEHRAPMAALIVDGMRWYEIDTAEDLRAAEALFAEPLNC